jgi:hypothetical protein
MARYRITAPVIYVEDGVAVSREATGPEAVELSDEVAVQIADSLELIVEAAEPVEVVAPTPTPESTPDPVQTPEPEKADKPDETKSDNPTPSDAAPGGRTKANRNPTG